MFSAENHLDEFAESVWNNQVTILTGPTGSGKSSILLPHLIDVGFADSGIIGVTEPRRPIAQWLMKYVSEKRGTLPGTDIGYQIRFDDRTNPLTRLKFMTDGILLREFQLDHDLRKYSVIVVDEAHEESLNIHLTLGLLKDLLKRRRDLRVVISSATLDEGKFSRYFQGAAIVNVKGQMFPTKVVYEDQDIDPDQMPRAVVRKIDWVHTHTTRGDLLVFMYGKAEIDQVVDGVCELGHPDLVAVPLYRDLPEEEKEKVLDSYPGMRKVIVSTNIAESGVTFNVLRDEIDSGLVKQKNFHSETGVDSLDTVETAQDSLAQRRGRIGRTCEGTCYRMFTEENYNRRPKYTTPEILRVGLSHTALLMEDLGIPDIPHFDFISPPKRQAFTEAYETLRALGAVDSVKGGLTDLGRAMAALPIDDPRQSRMILRAKDYGCVKNVATIAAFLSVRNPFARPKDKEKEADDAHRKFKNPMSDALTYLKVWDAYVQNGATDDWCFANFLQAKALSEVGMVRQQLFEILTEEGVELSESDDQEAIAKAVASGLVYNLFQHESSGRFRQSHSYRGVLRDVSDIYIHPSSVAWKGDPQWIVATEICETSRIFARGCTILNIGWLPEIAPNQFKFGKMKLKSFNKGDDFAMAERGVIYKGVSIGSALVKVSLEEAKKFQESMIAGSRSEGLVRLKFRAKKHPVYDYLTKVVANYNGTEYTSYSGDTKEGTTFYCRLNGSGIAIAEPVFQVFEFGPEKAPSVETVNAMKESQKPKNPKPAGTPGCLSGHLDVNKLAALWSARIKK